MVHYYYSILVQFIVVVFLAFHKQWFHTDLTDVCEMQHVAIVCACSILAYAHTQSKFSLAIWFCVYIHTNMYIAINVI